MLLSGPTSRYHKKIKKYQSAFSKEPFFRRRRQLLLKDKVPFSYLNTSVWMACYQEASGSGTHSARGVTFVHAIRGDIAAVHWANCADPEKKKSRRSKLTRMYSIKRNELAPTQGILEGKLGAWCWISCSIVSIELLSFATSIILWTSILKVSNLHKLSP